MPEQRSPQLAVPHAKGLIVVGIGLVVTCVGFAVFATMAKQPAASRWPGVLAVLSLLAGLGLVEVGSWLNAAFYRALEKAPVRRTVEIGGGVLLVAGAVVLGNCLALYWLGTSAAPVAGITVGLLLIELALAAEHRSVIRICTSPSFPVTMIVVGAAVLGFAALALVSIINVRHYRRIDLTEKGFYSLNDQTLKILQSVKKPMRIIATMVQNPNPAGPEQFRNFVRARATETLEEYANQSRRVDFISLNPYASPEAAEKLSAELKLELLADSIIFEYEGKTKVVEFGELLTTPPFPSMPPQFKAEEAFTGALQSLVEGETTKIYFVIGHGERDIDDYDRDGTSAIAEQVRKDNCEVKTCELPEIPDDCNVLVIAGPRTPFGSDELDAVRDFAGREGVGLLVLLDPVAGDAAPSGLEAIVKGFGVTVETGQTLVEMGRREILPGILGAGPTATIETTEYGKGPARMMGPPHPVVRDLKTMRTAFHVACPVRSDVPPRPSPYGGRPQGDPFTAQLVSTSSRAFAKTDFDLGDLARLRIDRDQDKPGPFTIAIARGRSKGQQAPMRPMGPPPPPSRIIVFGDSDFITNMYLQRGVRGNGTLFRNAVAWVGGREYKIGIPPKPLQQEHTIDMPREQKTIARWATVFAPPFHILVIGLVVWWIRRR